MTVKIRMWNVVVYAKRQVGDYRGFIMHTQVPH